MRRGRRHWELRVCLLTLAASTASQLPAPQDVSAQRSALSVLQLRPSICDVAPSAATMGAAESGGMRASETCCSCAQCCCNDIPGALPRRGQMHPLRGGGDGFGFLDRIIAAFLACVLRGEDDGACEARVGDGDPDIMWTEEDDPGELDQLGVSLQVCEGPDGGFDRSRVRSAASLSRAVLLGSCRAHSTDATVHDSLGSDGFNAAAFYRTRRHSKATTAGCRWIRRGV